MTVSMPYLDCIPSSLPRATKRLAISQQLPDLCAKCSGCSVFGIVIECVVYVIFNPVESLLLYVWIVLPLSDAAKAATELVFGFISLLVLLLCLFLSLELLRFCSNVAIATCLVPKLT